MASLPVSGAAAFLYTSKWDGIPIVLIEAIALGLPVVAPMVGSIAELVSEKTGYPVEQEADPEAYIARLRELLAAPDAAAAKVRHGQDLVCTRHSLQHFERQLKSLPGYAIGNNSA
jgi:glycosyltransferase involved in cell wall biosynthesis